MARINLDDEFWIRAGVLAGKLNGDLQRAIGCACLFIQLSQARYKQRKFITTSDFETHGLPIQLIGIFTIQIEPNLYQYYDYSEAFGWITERRQAGQKGGKSRSEKKLKNLKQFAAPGQRDFNNLAPKQNRSKTKQTEASSSSSSSFKCGGGFKGNGKKQNQFTTTTTNKNHWLVDLWNECRGELPEWGEVDATTAEKIEAVVAECSDKEKWRAVFTKFAASKYALGKTVKKDWVSRFDFFLEPGNRVRVAQGTFQPFNAPLKSTSEAKKAPPVSYDLDSEAKKRADAARAALKDDPYLGKVAKAF